KGCRVGLRIVLFEACSAFTHVTACTLATSPIRDALSRRLQPLRYLHSCSGCFPAGAFAGWDLHPLESAAFPRRTPISDNPGRRFRSRLSAASIMRLHRPAGAP